MRKIINGKIYDTETATRIHEWDNGRYGGDFSRCEESLNKTPRGAYFLYGEGGPMSKYARSVGQNSYGSGSGMAVISESEAMAWLESHDGDAALEEFFKDKLVEA